MKIALPISKNDTLYKDNPLTAPKFAIYNIEITQSADVYFSLDSIIENRLYQTKSSSFDSNELSCKCDKSRQENLRHICDHYALHELIKGCSYLLASKYCLNTKKSMQNVGIKMFKIPVIINKINFAINNFIIGGSFAYKITNIHHAS